MKVSKKPPYRCIIIDDDKTAIEIITQYIGKIEKLSLFKSYSDASKALNEIKVEDKIDFLFLDIRMDISGLDVGRLLRDKVEYLIFISSYGEYAIKGFEVNCDQFLLKPVEFEKFLSTINQVIFKKKRRMKFF